MKIYTAGPLGFSEAGRAFHNNTVIPEIRRLGHEPLDPWTLTDQRKIDAVLALSPTVQPDAMRGANSMLK
jgi:hypothetical protein